MLKEYVPFKQQRELGEVLSDTFKFIRQEYKGLFTALMRNAGIPFILLLAAAGYLAANATDFSFIFNPGTRPLGFGNIFISYGFYAIASLLYTGFMFGSVLHYIRNYIETKGQVNQEIVGSRTRSSLGSILGLSVISFFMIMIGMALCFFPGVYVAVVLSLVFPILIFRNMSVGDSISESFQLIKNEWWMTFVTLIVMYLIIYLISLVFQIPLLIYTLVKAFTHSQEMAGGDMSGMFDWVYITLNVVSSGISYLFQVILVIATAFIFFNLNEKKNQTGTLEQIDTIGSLDR